jgi:stage III sporulation protein AC
MWRRGMEVGLILKIAGIGILVSVISTVLTKSGKDEQAMMVSIGGIVMAMLMLVEEIGNLIDTVRSVFGI